MVQRGCQLPNLEVWDAVLSLHPASSLRRKMETEEEEEEEQAAGRGEGTSDGCLFTAGEERIGGGGWTVISCMQV